MSKMVRLGYDVKTLAKPQKYSLQDLDNMRYSIHFRPLLDAMASDVMSLGFTVEGDPVKVELWQYFIDNNLKRVLKEMIVSAWIFGRAYADTNIQMKLTSSGVYKYVSNAIPLDSVRVKSTDTGMKYALQDVDIERLFELTLFEEFGKPFANGQIYKKYVDALEALTQSWVQSTAANSIGIFVITDDGQNPAQQDEDAELDEALAAHGQQIGMSLRLPAGKKAEIIASPSTQDFKEPITYVTYAILSSFRSQWTMNQTINGGSNYNTTKLRESYYEYINWLADCVLNALHLMDLKMSSWQNQEDLLYKEVIFKHTPAGKTLTPEFANAVKTICDINNITANQKEYLLDMLGLPSSQIQETTVNINEGLVNTRLTVKKNSVWAVFQSHFNNKLAKKPYGFRLSNALTIANELQLDEQQAAEFQLKWSALQDKLIATIRNCLTLDKAKQEYNKIWDSFIKEVSDWKRQ